MGLQEFGGDDEKEDKGAEGGKRIFHDFDCPVCNANNPYDDGFSDGAEVRCFYCGAEFRVVAGDGGKPRFKEL